MNGTACAIGSLPHTDPKSVVGFILNQFDGIPFWPQLPRRDFRESFYVQYSEGLPARVVDPKGKRIYFDTEDGLAQLADFYERIMAGDTASFAVSPDYAAGLYALTDRLGEKKVPLLKGHVTGALSFALSIEDHKGRLLAYDQNFFDMLVKGVLAKGLWQTDYLSRFAEKVMIFFDEPGLVGVGSAFVQITREQVTESLATTVHGVQERGAQVGIHCCANTDWSLIFSSDPDVLSFDAFSFFDNLLLYPEPLDRFYAQGGRIAFGIVPTDDRVFSLEAETLVQILTDQIDALVRLGIDRETILRQSLISPACGLGTTPVDLAERALLLTGRTARLFKSRFGLSTL